MKIADETTGNQLFSRGGPAPVQNIMERKSIRGRGKNQELLNLELLVNYLCSFKSL